MNGLKIYRSSTLGDETTAPVEVNQLPPKEAELAARFIALSTDIKRALDVIKLAEDEVAKLRSSCKHHYFTDTAGFPYDIRHCAVCGTNRGQL